MTARVLAALSGGVDSAVAAALLVDQGHAVTGVHLKLARVPFHDQVPGQGCCSFEDARDARRVADLLEIPFYTWDLREPFREAVQQPFVDAYAAGRTPNPCVRCNERVKYRALLDRARRLGFDALATGHHARLRRGDGPLPGPGARLLRGADARKDQSYVLYMAHPDELAHSLFPVGELTKDEVRRVAADRGLPVADKPDSYEICFVPGGDTGAYLAERLPTVAGEIVDLDGSVLGQHEGVWHYTVGQRRGLGLDHHERRYVVALDADRNRVVVGPADALEVDRLGVGSVSWTTGVPPEGTVGVQIRAHGEPVPGRVAPVDDGWRVDLEEPLRAVAQGQAAVFYDGEECLGGGTITAAERPVAIP